MNDGLETPKTSTDETDLRTPKVWATPRLTVSAVDDAEAGPPGLVDAGVLS